MGIQINGQTDTVTATDGSINIGGDVTVPGVLTYEDVTSVDAIGLSTFQNGIHVTGGSVGIGTTNPQQKLHIVDETSANIYIETKNQDAGSTAGIYFKTSETGIDNFFKSAIVLEDDGTSWARGKLHILQDNTADDSNATLSDSVITINQIGGVGIGSTNPVTKLDVVTELDVANVLRVRNETQSLNIGVNNDVGGSFIFESLNNALRFGTNDIERLRITGIGSVGIGTTNPVGSLEIRDSKANLIVAKDGLTVKSNSDLHTTYDTLQIGAGGALLSYSTETVTADTQFVHNAYRSSEGSFKYRYADSAARIRMNSPQGEIIFDNAVNGSADDDITFNERLRITGIGSVGINTTTPVTRLEIGGSDYGSNLTGSVGFQLTSKTDATGVAFNMVQREGYRWIQYHGSTSSWIGKGNYGFAWNDGVADSTGLSVGITTEGYIIGNRNVVQVIDATRSTMINGAGTQTLVTSPTIKCNSNKSRFMIHVHCPMNSSDDSDAGNGNENPYFYGQVERSINGGTWTICGGRGSSSQGGYAAHIELSPNRTGSNTTDYWSGNRYRMEHKYAHFFDNELSIGTNATIQFRLRIINSGGANWFQVGEPHGFGTDDNYPCQGYGMMIYELGPDTRFTVENKVP